jgi:hypothetical protein
MRLAKAVEAGSDPERLHLENVVEVNNKTIQQLRLQLESFHKQSNTKVRNVSHCANYLFIYFFRET